MAYEQSFEKKHPDDSDRIYIAIDLKSFYASIECVARGRDPLTTNLLVADESRTAKTICLAVSPSLKSYGIPGRARLFEAIAKVDEVNRVRHAKLRGKDFTGKSDDYDELSKDMSLAVDFIVARPRMREYMRISTQIYSIYLRYVAPEDIFAYSVDEVFIDATAYLKTYNLSPHDFAMMLVKEVLSETGITATAGIGTNMYLAKIAMDIEAKHISADADGVRVAFLDVLGYRKKLWEHKPITDFWRVGKGVASRLYARGIYTMKDIAICSLRDEELLYHEFGISAEILIDHAWGYEPATMSDVKSYKPKNNSISQGQVLSEPYDFEKGLLIVQEMTDMLVLDLVARHMVTDQMVLTVGYDIENLKDGREYDGAVESDRYGRLVPKQAHGSVNLGKFSSSTKLIMEKVTELYRRIVDENLTVRRMSIAANHVMDENSVPEEPKAVQLSLFDMMASDDSDEEAKKRELEKEKKAQRMSIKIKERFGNNAILKGMNYKEGATARERNRQVGGHRE